MIIFLLFTAVLSLLETIIVVTVPSYNAVGDMFDYFNLIVDKGYNIYRYFIPPYGQVVFTAILVMEAFYFIYKFVMWIVTKIPMLSIGDKSE